MSDIKIGFFKSDVLYWQLLSFDWAKAKKRVSSGSHTRFNSLQWLELKLNAQFSVGFSPFSIHPFACTVRAYTYVRVSQSISRKTLLLIIPIKSMNWTHFESNWTIQWFNVWNSCWAHSNETKWNECKKEMRRETQNEIGVYSGSAAVSLSDVWHQTIDPL